MGRKGGQQRLAGFTHMGSKVLLSQDFSASKFSMIILTTIQSGPSPASPEQQWQQSVAVAARARGPSQERGGTAATTVDATLLATSGLAAGSGSCRTTNNPPVGRGWVVCVCVRETPLSDRCAAAREAPACQGRRLRAFFFFSFLFFFALPSPSGGEDSSDHGDHRARITKMATRGCRESWRSLARKRRGGGRRRGEAGGEDEARKSRRAGEERESGLRGRC